VTIGDLALVGPLGTIVFLEAVGEVPRSTGFLVVGGALGTLVVPGALGESNGFPVVLVVLATALGTFGLSAVVGALGTAGFLVVLVALGTGDGESPILLVSTTTMCGLGLEVGAKVRVLLT
jgi:hypothetical protein